MRRVHPLAAATALFTISLAVPARPCFAAPAEGSATFTLPPAPPGLRPYRDDTRSPVVTEAGRLLRDKLWRPAPPDEATRRELKLPMGRLVNEDHGNITVVRGDNGELDVNWEDPQQLQDALLSIIESFYRNHPNRNPHFITVVTTFQVQSLAAFYMPLANDVRGIGYRHSGQGDEVFNYVGGGLALDGIIFMNSFRGYSGVYAPLGRLTFNQELGHRWGAHVAFQGRRGESLDLLGRDCSHWSFFMDADNSAMEGNQWIDNGDGTYRTDNSYYEFGFNQLDRYLMGFAPAEAVRPFFYISGAGGWSCSQTYRNGELNPSHYPPIFGGAGQDQVEVSGTRVDVSLDDVIAAEGRRDPEYGIARNVWSMAVILAARRNDTINDQTIQTVDDLRLEWEYQWEEDATEPGYESPDLITSVDGSNEPPEPPVEPDTGAGLGESCLAFEDCNPNETERCVGTNAGIGVCTKTCDAPADCPTDFCCVPSVPGPRQDRYDWYCLRKTGDVCEDTAPVGPVEEGEGGANGAGGAGGGAGGRSGEGGSLPLFPDTDGGPVGPGPGPAGDDAGLTNENDPQGAVKQSGGGGSAGCQGIPARGVPGASLVGLALAAGLVASGRRRRRR